MLQSLLAPPGLGDVFALMRYVLADPYLFIGSTTVMTTGLVAAAITLAALGIVARRRSGRPARAIDHVLAWVAPRLSLVLAYFGVGSMALATQILIRFHDINPIGTEVQFRSGIGHLLVAVLGVAVLRPHARGLSARSWIEAHFWALTYLTVHVLVFTPPWFEFQFQFDLVMGAARAMLIAALALNLYGWWKVASTRSEVGVRARRMETAPAERSASESSA